MPEEFMKLGEAIERVLEVAQMHATETKDLLAIDVVTDWATNNLEEDD